MNTPYVSLVKEYMDTMLLHPAMSQISSFLFSSSDLIFFSFLHAILARKKKQLHLVQICKTSAWFVDGFSDCMFFTFIFFSEAVIRNIIEQVRQKLKHSADSLSRCLQQEDFNDTMFQQV